jgi:hypothetical protein
LNASKFAASSSAHDFRERMLDALVLTDRPPEHDALFRVLRRTLQRRAPKANRFGSKQNALGIEARSAKS